MQTRWGWAKRPRPLPWPPAMRQVGTWVAHRSPSSSLQMAITLHFISANAQEEWPVLIVTPASLRLAWAEELERWLPRLRPASIHLIESRTDRVCPQRIPPVTVTSYEMLQRLCCDACKGRSPGQGKGACPPCEGNGCMASVGWKVVIADESHTLRTSSHPPDAFHTEATTVVARRAKRAVFLTGTPSLSKPFDLFRQVDALHPGLLGASRQQFAVVYCGRRLVPCPHRREPGAVRYDNSGLRRGAELHLLLRSAVMLRRLKSEVLSQLPAKRRQLVMLPIKVAPAKRAREEDGDDSGAEDPVPGDTASVASEAQKTGLLKLPSAVEWLRSMLGQYSSDAADGPPCKVLVFAHHRAVMSGLAAALEGGGSTCRRVGYVLIDGQTDPEDRSGVCA